MSFAALYIYTLVVGQKAAKQRIKGLDILCFFVFAVSKYSSHPYLSWVNILVV